MLNLDLIAALEKINKEELAHLQQSLGQLAMAGQGNVTIKELLTPVELVLNTNLNWEAK